MNAHTPVLREHFTNVLQLTPQAVEYLCELWETIQSLDDWVDGDESSRPEKERAIWNAVGGLQLQPFAMQNPCLGFAQATAFLKWMGADRVEREGGNLHVAFVWRAGYYDIVLLCVLLVHGAQKAMGLAHLVLALYGESFDDYVQEITNARSNLGTRSG